MKCGETQVRLADEVLGEISGPDREAVAGHLAGCAVCAEERRAFAEAVGVLRDMDWPAVEPVLAPPQRQQVEERAAAPRPDRRRLVVLWLTSLAAAAAMAAIALPGFRGRRASPLQMADEMSRNAAAPTVAAEVQAKPVDAERKARSPERAVPAKRHDGVAASPEAGSQVIATTVPPTTTLAPMFAYYATDPRVASSTHFDVTAGVEGGVPGGVAGGVVGGVGDTIHRLARSCANCMVSGDERLAQRVGGALPHDMFFQHQGTNPFVSPEDDALSTFGLDVDTASYTVMRNYLGRGELPPASAVRVEEFVNALPQDYAPPRREAFAIHVEGAPHPFRSGYHLLRVGLKAREVRAHERKPANLTFVIDVSGSMAMENRLGLVKRSLRLLVKSLDERDRVGIVVYGTRGRVVLDPTPASDRTTLLRAIDSLHPEGSTNLEEGLDLGYRMALDALTPGATNRVVLCTDGVANNGVTDAPTLLRRIHERAEKRVFLTALGFGMGNYNDALLQKLADQGDGQYAYIDDDREAERFFLRNLSGVLEVVARDAKAQIEFDPAAVESYRLLGYEKRDVADQDFRNDEVDGGEVGAGHAVTVLYELKLRGEGQRIGTVNVRFVDPDSGSPQELSREIEGADVARRFDAASAGFRLTALTARFAEHLRGSRWVRGEGLDEVLEAAERLPRRTLGEGEASDLLDLMRQAVALTDARERPKIR